MSREKALIKNTGILALGDFFPKFLTVLITPILTAQLTKVEYGEYDLIITLVTLLLPVATLQISSAAFRFLIGNRDNKTEIEKIISTTVFFTVIVAFVFFAISAPILLVNRGVIGFFISLYFVFYLLLITVQQIMRGLGNNILYSASAIVQAVVSLVSIYLLTGGMGFANEGLFGVVLALLLSTFVPCIVITIKCKMWKLVKKGAFDLKILKEMISYSWPMVPNNLSIWVLNLSDRILITTFLGLEANAVYSVANKLPTIFSSFQNTFVMAWQENASLATEDEDKDAYYSKMCNWIFRLLIGIMSGLIMCTPIIWNILIRGDYSDAYQQLPILYVAMIFSCMSSTLGGIYIAHMKTKSVGLTTMAAALLNFVINIVFIRIIGIWAASISTMCSYLILWIFRLIDVQKFQKIKYDMKILTLGVTMISIMAILCMFNRPIMNYINIALCGLILVSFDRDIIVFFVYTLRNRIKK